MGGGRQEMGADTTSSRAHTKQKCVRGDGRNLAKEWREEKRSRGRSHAYVTTTGQLRQVEVEKTEFLMGLFADLHMPFEVDRNTSLDGTPDLREMTSVAVRRLRRSEKGFFLLVESGRIDHGLHYSQPRRALEEILAMEEALKETLDLVDLNDTLVLVTADHSHVMTINGYPRRGNDILGLVNYEKVTDGLPFTTLMFTNGFGFNYTWNGEKVVRPNLTGTDTASKDYVAQAGVATRKGSATHGGEDVAVYAVGPMSHLFHRVHEQTHVAHVMAYSACIGPYKNCDRLVESPRNRYQTKSHSTYPNTSGGASSVLLSSICLPSVVVMYCLGFMWRCC
ncbi:alkaline phosphatase, tissue-nonspecific isozyme [Penaeus vannamei]|uniref:alkaline phosphatase, tissue-nonspecific isozyme n=1 Tax=Penaeus vannamei TaxID=6689 RepID=UPI00387F669C